MFIPWFNFEMHVAAKTSNYFNDALVHYGHNYKSILLK